MQWANCTGTVTNITEQGNRNPQDLSRCCWWITVVCVHVPWYVFFFFFLFLEVMIDCMLTLQTKTNEKNNILSMIYHFVISVIILFSASLAALTGICTVFNRRLRNVLYPQYSLLDKCTSCSMYFLNTFGTKLYLISSNLSWLKTQLVFKFLPTDLW